MVWKFATYVAITQSIPGKRWFIYNCAVNPELTQTFRLGQKEPGKAGVCETTPGVDSYSGYVSLNETTNMFFWFFE